MRHFPILLKLSSNFIYLIVSNALLLLRISSYHPYNFALLSNIMLFIASSNVDLIGPEESLCYCDDDWWWWWWWWWWIGRSLPALLNRMLSFGLSLKIDCKLSSFSSSYCLLRAEIRIACYMFRIFLLCLLLLLMTDFDKLIALKEVFMFFFVTFLRVDFANFYFNSLSLSSEPRNSLAIIFTRW